MGWFGQDKTWGSRSGAQYSLCSDETLARRGLAGRSGSRRASLQAINLSSLGPGPLAHKRAKRPARAAVYQAGPNEPRAQKGRCVCREAFNVPGLPHSAPLWAPSAACLSRPQIRAHSQDARLALCARMCSCVRACMPSCICIYKDMHCTCLLQPFFPDLCYFEQVVCEYSAVRKRGRERCS